MRRTRIDGAVALLVVATLTCAATSHAESEEPRTVARSHFSRGVELTKDRDYVAALREFELAYATVPHFGVLYNIAQAQLALGRDAEAASTLAKYLQEGGDAIEPERRAEVQATLDRLQANAARAPAENEVSTSGPAPRAEPPTTPPSPVASETAAKPPVPAPSSATPPAPLIPLERGPQPRPQPTSTSSVLGYVLGGVSVALGGAALAHYAWNRSRYDDWQSDYRAYRLAPSDVDRLELNQRSRSIASASVVSVALGIGAAVTLASGAVLVVTSRSSAEASRGATESTLSLRGTF
jgi:hypothetical protein